MKVAITGANGFVGTALRQHLELLGHEVTALIRHQSTTQTSNSVMVDYSNPASLKDALIGHEIVIHLIGKTHSQDSLKAINDYRRVNVELSQTIATACAECEIKTFIYLSSIKAMGENQHYCADSTPAPTSAYGISKLEAEQALQAIAQNSDMHLVVIRPPLIYCPMAKGNIERLRHAISQKRPLPLKSIKNKRSIVTLPDLCQIVASKLSPLEPHCVLLPTTPPTISTSELIERIARDSRMKARLLPLPPALLKFALRISGRSQEYEKLCGNLEVSPNIIVKNQRVTGL